MFFSSFTSAPGSPTIHTNLRGQINRQPFAAEVTEQLKLLTNDVKDVKRTLQVITEAQEEILGIVKKLKHSQESQQFDCAKCCHTENINQLLGKFYATKGRYGVECPDKERALKLEFSNSPTGMTCQELMIRFRKYENAKFSYWRSEERRRLLGIAGNDWLLGAPTDTLTDKIIHLIGHKHTGCNKPQLLKEIIVARKYIREITVERARKLKGFWSSFYSWKTNKWPNGISQEDWNVLHHEDKISYQEE
ncbi:Hypothetical predicted protein [Paramuricea clavata]|uniref:Uncharacterized protein n=1 Tax=Paramuricea clavata TaxID=317549 RepID=A0A6S7IR94_PARCT|nr:Hypothetical predicted protein [Paramuricea clavata]